jgi:hypothetical protein
VLLSTAAQREDGAIELAPNRKGGASHKVVGKLLRDGLIEEISARGALPVWRRDPKQHPQLEPFRSDGYELQSMRRHLRESKRKLERFGR